MPAPMLTALVLAGPRSGGDPLANAFDVPHKAVLPVAGRPMGEWVVDALRACPLVERVLVAAEWRSLGEAVALMAAEWRSLGEAVALMAPEKVVPVAARSTIGATVEAVLDAVAPPLLITTVDNPLLTPAIVAEFLAKVPAEADGAVAVVRREVVRAAYPQARRAYMRFRRARVTGCNLFLLVDGRARRAVRVWTHMDADRTDPAAMIGALGLRSRLLWSLGLLTLDGAARRLSRRVGATLAVVELSAAEAALDVDCPEDLILAETILRNRGQ